MKLLFDQNISPFLVERFGGLFPGSTHVQLIGFDRKTDAALWDFAHDNGFIIVTKDVDFCDRSALLGHPPKVIWVRLGNCTTSEIESALRAHHVQIMAFAMDEALGVLAVFG